MVDGIWNLGFNDIPYPSKNQCSYGCYYITYNAHIHLTLEKHSP
jgi:hypothetical protein